MVAKGGFEVTFGKLEVVKAALPLQEHWLPMSNLDLLLPPLDVGVFFCYNNNNNNKLNMNNAYTCMVNVLKKSMAETLISYFAFAGEVVQNHGGEPELLCNNRGVDFSEASANVELKDINFYNPDQSVEGKLVPKKKQGVLAVQVTELRCGGIVVGCTFDHRVADAYSTNMFLVSWAEMAQSKPLSQSPSFRRSLLFPRRPGSYDAAIDNMYLKISIPPPPKESPEPPAILSEEVLEAAISRIYYIPANQVAQLQFLANGENENAKLRKRTKLEAFSAYLWKLIAKGKQGYKSCRLGIVVDGRSRLMHEEDENQVKLLKGYFGNVLSIPFGEEKIANLNKNSLSWVANEVHEFLEKAVTKEHFRGLIDWVEAHRSNPLVARIYAEEGPAVAISSGQQFPVKKVDFGWGEAVFGSYHFPWGGQSGYVMPMPSPKGNGDWVVYMHLMKEQLQLIETHARDVFKQLSSDYLLN